MFKRRAKVGTPRYARSRVSAGEAPLVEKALPRGAAGYFGFLGDALVLRQAISFSPDRYTPHKRRGTPANRVASTAVIRPLIALLLLIPFNWISCRDGASPPARRRALATAAQAVQSACLAEAEVVRLGQSSWRAVNRSPRQGEFSRLSPSPFFYDLVWSIVVIDRDRAEIFPTTF
jgi:hypothetical protein